MLYTMNSNYLRFMSVWSLVGWIEILLSKVLQFLRILQSIAIWFACGEINIGRRLNEIGNKQKRKRMRRQLFDKSFDRICTQSPLHNFSLFFFSFFVLFVSLKVSHFFLLVFWNSSQIVASRTMDMASGEKSNFRTTKLMFKSFGSNIRRQVRYAALDRQNTITSYHIRSSNWINLENLTHAKISYFKNCPQRKILCSMCSIFKIHFNSRIFEVQIGSRAWYEIWNTFRHA